MTSDDFKVGDRVVVKLEGLPEHFTGVIIDISTRHNFLKVKSDITGLEQWHQAEWCKKI